GHRANKGDILHDLGKLMPRLGDLDAGDGSRDFLRRPAVGDARLRVEGFKLARPAAHEEQHARHALLAPLVGGGGHGFFPAHDPEPRRRSCSSQKRTPAENPIPPRANVHQGLQHIAPSSSEPGTLTLISANPRLLPPTLADVRFSITTMII